MVNDGNGGDNYTANVVSQNTTGVINKAALTITATANTKTYDGTASAAATPTVVGLVGGDTVTGLSETYDNKNAGTGKTLTVAAGYAVSDGNGGANYAVTTATSTAGVVNKAPLTVTAAANTKTYDGSTSAAATPTITGGSLVGGDTPAFTETYDNKNVGTGKTLTPVGSVNDGNGGANYTVTTVTSTAGVINQATLTITAAANTKTYDSTTSAATAPTVVGLVGSDTVTGLSETYDNKNAGTGKTLTVAAGYAVSDGNSGANYAVTTATSTAGVINQAPLTITAAANTKTYDGTTSAAATPTVSGLQGSDTVTGLSETYDTSAVGTGKTLTVSAGYVVNDGNSGANYAVTTATSTAGVINSTATAGVSGHVYVQIGAGAPQWGIPGVTLMLTATNGGPSTQWAITDTAGSYSFGSLPAGTYQITETPPSKFLAATETVGNAGGQAQTNGFSGIVLAAGQQGTGYNFISPGLSPFAISLRLFMSSAPPSSQVLLDLHDPPVVALDGSQGTNFSTSVKGGSPLSSVAIVSPSAKITAADNGALKSLTVAINNNNPPDGSLEKLTADTSVLGPNPPIISTPTNGGLMLSGYAAASDYELVLRTIAYSDMAASPTVGSREITFMANDLIDDSNTAISTLTIQSDPPANSLTDQVLASTDNWLGG